MEGADRGSQSLALLAASVAVALASLDLSALNVALTPIERDFDSSLFNVGWVLNGYLVAFAIAESGNYDGDDRSTPLLLAGPVAGGIIGGGAAILLLVIQKLLPSNRAAAAANVPEAQVVER